MILYLLGKSKKEVLIPRNAYSEVLINMACLNKTEKMMSEVENEDGGQRA